MPIELHGDLLVLAGSPYPGVVVQGVHRLECLPNPARELDALFLPLPEATGPAVDWGVALLHLEPVARVVEVLVARGTVALSHTTVTLQCALLTPDFVTFAALLPIVPESGIKGLLA